MSKQTSVNVKEIISEMCQIFLEKAEAIAAEKKEQAESRSQENYDKQIADMTEKLESEFKREDSEVQKSLLIRQAQIQNNVKLEILKSQTEALHEALKEAINQLNKYSEGPEYKELLTNLIAEGFDRLKESRVHLMVRKKDLQLAQEVLNDAIKIAQDANPGLKIQAKIDTVRFLPQAPQCAGGVILLCQKGKIRVSNVLNDRLKLAYEGMLPHIRRIVLGEENH